MPRPLIQPHQRGQRARRHHRAIQQHHIAQRPHPVQQGIHIRRLGNAEPRALGILAHLFAHMGAVGIDRHRQPQPRRITGGRAIGEVLGGGGGACEQGFGHQTGSVVQLRKNTYRMRTNAATVKTKTEHFVIEYGSNYLHYGFTPTNQRLQPSFSPFAQACVYSSAARAASLATPSPCA